MTTTIKHTTLRNLFLVLLTLSIGCGAEEFVDEAKGLLLQKPSVINHDIDSGLTGIYYNGLNFNDEMFRKIDPTIDYDWGKDMAGPNLDKDMFSVKWVGSVKAQYSEKYTFIANTDEGIRLWINNTVLIDDWNSPPSLTTEGSIELTAGVLYNLKFEYYDESGDAFAQLFWSSPSQEFQVVPKAYLFEHYEAFDSCPDDPEKTEPGYCGCGNKETDTDNDGMPDCKDECNKDPRKIKAGYCGCGIKEGSCGGFDEDEEAFSYDALGTFDRNEPPKTTAKTTKKKTTQPVPPKTVADKPTTTKKPGTMEISKPPVVSDTTNTDTPPKKVKITTTETIDDTKKTNDAEKASPTEIISGADSAEDAKKPAPSEMSTEKETIGDAETTAASQQASDTNPSTRVNDDINTTGTTNETTQKEAPSEIPNETKATPDEEEMNKTKRSDDTQTTDTPDQAGDAITTENTEPISNTDAVDSVENTDSTQIMNDTEKTETTEAPDANDRETTSDTDDTKTSTDSDYNIVTDDVIDSI